MAGPQEVLKVEALSIENIFRAELSYVTHTLRRLGVRERDLEDVAQDVFVTVNRRLPSYDSERPLRPWLFGIARNHMLRYRDKAQHRREKLDPVPVDRSEALGAGSSAVAQHEARTLVIQALQAVSIERRSVLIMADIDGFTAGEIAAALEVPENTVYSRLRLGREQFTKRVRRLVQENRP